VLFIDGGHGKVALMGMHTLTDSCSMGTIFFDVEKLSDVVLYLESCSLDAAPTYIVGFFALKVS
jgi:hypothetical protein